MQLTARLNRLLRQGTLALLPAAVLASLADAAVLGGLRLFLALAGDSLPISLPAWLPTLHGCSNGALIGLWALAMLALVALRLAALAWRLGKSERLTRFVEGLLRVWLRTLVKRMPPRFYHTQQSEETLKSAEESCRVLTLSVEAMGQALQATLQLAVFLPLLLWLSWPLTLALLCGMLPLMAWMQRYLRRLGKGMDARIGLQGHYEAQLGTWQALVRHWTLPADIRQVESGLARDARMLKRDGLRLGLRKATLVQVADSVAALAIVAVLAFCGFWLRTGGMRPSDLVLFAAALILCHKPVKDCLRLVPLLREAVAAHGALAKLEELRKNSMTRAGAFPPDLPKTESVCLQAVDFRYTDGISRPVLQQCSLALPLGKPAWLRGPNGCGKTTLLRLLAGLEVADAGSITWHASWHKAEKAFLSHKGILPPVAFLSERLQHALTTNGKLGTLLQRLGIASLLDREGLSAGQRQRLGIAWVFCSGAPILLLDEPLAFVAERERADLLQLMVTQAHEQGRWLALASHYPIPAPLLDSFHVVELEVQA